MEFEILVGAQLDQGQFNNLKTQIEGLGKTPIPIKLELGEAKKQLEDLQKLLSSFGKNDKKGLANLSIKDTSSITTSISKLAGTIDKINSAMGSLDKNSGMKSLLSSVNEINSALNTTSSEIKSLTNAFSKGFNFNLKIGGQDAASKSQQLKKAAEDTTIALKKEAKALEELFGGQQKMFGMAVGTNKMSNLIEAADKANDSSLTSVNRMNGLKEYIAVMKELASIKGIDISSVTSKFSGDANKFVEDTNKIASGEKYLEDATEKLRSVFGTGLNSEALTAQLNSVIEKLTELAEVVKNISAVFSGGKFNINNVENLLNVGSGKDSSPGKKVNEVSEAYKRLISVIKEMSSIRLDLNKIDINRNAKEVDVLINRYDELQKEYNEIQRTFSGQFTDKQNAGIKQELDKALYNKTLSSAKIADKAVLEQEAQAAKKAQEAYQQLVNTASKMNKLELQIGGLKAAGGNENQIAQLTSQLEVLREKYNSVMSEINGKLSVGQIGNLDSISKDLQSQLSLIQAKVQDTRNELAKEIQVKFDNGTLANESSKIEQQFSRLKEATTESVTAMEQFRTASTDLHTALQSGDIDKITSSYQKYQQALKTADNQIKVNLRSEREAAEATRQVAREQEVLTKSSTLSNDMQTWLNNNKKAAQQYGNEIKRLQAQLNGNINDGKLKDISLRFKEIKSEASSAGMTVKSFGKSLKDMTLMTLGISSSYMAIQKGIQTVRQMFDEVLKVDTAMTELYRITDLSQQKYTSLYQNMSASAKEYGSTLDDMINSTADWVRLGFKTDDSNRLAEITSMYQHVTDLSNDVAVENLVTAYKGFEDSLLELTGGDTTKSVELVADIYDKLGNEFAVSAANVGDGLQRSASALQLAGNTIQESAAMVTGITEVTQQPEKAGTGLKVLSLRLRGMKGDLEELGEEIDPNVESISKMQTQILNLTHGKVNIFKDDGSFKSTFQIMKEISEIYDHLTDTERADLLETIAGRCSYPYVQKCA